MVQGGPAEVSGQVIRKFDQDIFNTPCFRKLVLNEIRMAQVALGDTLVSVDDHDVQGISDDALAKLIIGPIGTKVEFVFENLMPPIIPHSARTNVVVQSYAISTIVSAPRSAAAPSPSPPSAHVQPHLFFPHR